VALLREQPSIRYSAACRSLGLPFTEAEAEKYGAVRLKDWHITNDPTAKVLMSYGDGWTTCMTVDTAVAEQHGCEAVLERGCNAHCTSALAFDDHIFVAYRGTIGAYKARSMVYLHRSLPAVQVEHVYPYPKGTQIKGAVHCAAQLLVERYGCDPANLVVTHKANCFVTSFKDAEWWLDAKHGKDYFVVFDPTVIDDTIPYCGYGTPNRCLHRNEDGSYCSHDTDEGTALCREHGGCNIWCEYCGDSLHPDVEYIVTADGRYFCADDCAAREGYHYCVDTEDYRGDAVQADDTHNWFSSPDDLHYIIDTDQYVEDDYGYYYFDAPFAVSSDIGYYADICSEPVLIFENGERKFVKGVVPDALASWLHGEEVYAYEGHLRRIKLTGYGSFYTVCPEGIRTLEELRAHMPDLLMNATDKSKDHWEIVKVPLKDIVEDNGRLIVKQGDE